MERVHGTSEEIAATEILTIENGFYKRTTKKLIGAQLAFMSISKSHKAF